MFHTASSALIVALLTVAAIIGRTDGSHRRSIDLKLDVDADIKEPVEQMFRSKQLKAPPEKDAIEKIKSLKKELLAEMEGDEDESKKETNPVSNGIVQIMTGIIPLVNGVSNSDSLSTLTGALEISGGIVQLVSPFPQSGKVLTTALSLVSTIYSLFDGSAANLITAEQEMMEQITDSGIKESEIKQLKEEINEALNIYKSLAGSLQQLRQQQQQQQQQPEGKRKKRLSIQQAISFYNQALQELVFLGQTKQAIKKYCESGVFEYNESNQEEHNKQVVQNANTCSIFVRLYTELSIQRQFVLTDVIALISDASEESKPGNNKDFLKQTAVSFIYMMLVEQRGDMDLLRFLISPINYPAHGFAVYNIYDSPNKNGLTLSYIKSLCNIFPESCPVGLTACSKHFLEGRCITVQPGTDLKLSSKYASYVIAPGTKVKEYTFNTVGPSAEAYLIYPSSTFDVTSSSPEEKRKQHMRLCYPWREIANNLPKTHQCRRFPEQSSVPSFSGDSGSGLEAVSIPQGHHAVFVYEDDSSKEYQFYGPNDINVFCRQKRIESIKLIKDKHFTKTVKICSEQNFKGNCYKIPVKMEKNQPAVLEIKKENTGGCDFGTPKSIAIPKGVEVTCYSDGPKEEGSFGPILGPASLSEIDFDENLKSSSDKGNNEIKMLKIVDTFTQIEVCEEEKLYGACYLYPIIGQDNAAFTGEQAVEYPTDFQPKSARIPAGIKAEFETGTTVYGPKLIGKFENTIADSTFTFEVIKVEDL